MMRSSTEQDRTLAFVTIREEGYCIYKGPEIDFELGYLLETLFEVECKIARCGLDVGTSNLRIGTVATLDRIHYRTYILIWVK